MFGFRKKSKNNSKLVDPDKLLARSNQTVNEKTPDVKEDCFQVITSEDPKIVKKKSSIGRPNSPSLEGKAAQKSLINPTTDPKKVPNDNENANSYPEGGRSSNSSNLKSSTGENSKAKMISNIADLLTRGLVKKQTRPDVENRNSKGNKEIDVRDFPPKEKATFLAEGGEKEAFKWESPSSCIKQELNSSCPKPRGSITETKEANSFGRKSIDKSKETREPESLINKLKLLESSEKKMDQEQNTAKDRCFSSITMKSVGETNKKSEIDSSKISEFCSDRPSKVFSEHASLAIEKKKSPVDFKTSESNGVILIEGNNTKEKRHSNAVIFPVEKPRDSVLINKNAEIATNEPENGDNKPTTEQSDLESESLHIKRLKIFSVTSPPPAKNSSSIGSKSPIQNLGQKARREESFEKKVVALPVENSPGGREGKLGNSGILPSKERISAFDDKIEAKANNKNEKTENTKSKINSRSFLDVEKRESEILEIKNESLLTDSVITLKYSITQPIGSSSAINIAGDETKHHDVNKELGKDRKIAIETNRNLYNESAIGQNKDASLNSSPTTKKERAVSILSPDKKPSELERKMSEYRTRTRSFNKETVVTYDDKKKSLLYSQTEEEQFEVKKQVAEGTEKPEIDFDMHRNLVRNSQVDNLQKINDSEEKVKNRESTKKEEQAEPENTKSQNLQKNETIKNEKGLNMETSNVNKTSESSESTIKESPAKKDESLVRKITLKHEEKIKLQESIKIDNNKIGTKEIGNKIEKGEPKIEKGKPIIEKGEPKIEKGKPIIEKGEPKIEKGELKIEKREPKIEKGEPKIEKREPKIDKREIDNRLQKMEPGINPGNKFEKTVTDDKIEKRETDGKFDKKETDHKSGTKSTKDKMEVDVKIIKKESEADSKNEKRENENKFEKKVIEPASIKPKNEEHKILTSHKLGSEAAGGFSKKEDGLKKDESKTEASIKNEGKIKIDEGKDSTSTKGPEIQDNPNFNQRVKLFSATDAKVTKSPVLQASSKLIQGNSNSGSNPSDFEKKKIELSEKKTNGSSNNIEKGEKQTNGSSNNIEKGEKQNTAAPVVKPQAFRKQESIIGKGKDDSDTRLTKKGSILQVTQEDFRLLGKKQSKTYEDSVTIQEKAEKSNFKNELNKKLTFGKMPMFGMGGPPPKAQKQPEQGTTVQTEEKFNNVTDILMDKPAAPKRQRKMKVNVDFEI